VRLQNFDVFLGDIWIKRIRSQLDFRVSNLSR